MQQQCRAAENHNYAERHPLDIVDLAVPITDPGELRNSGDNCNGGRNLNSEELEGNEKQDDRKQVE